MPRDEICVALKHRKSLFPRNYTVLVWSLYSIFTTISFAQDFWIWSGLDSNKVELLSAGPNSSLYAGVLQPGVPERLTIYRSTDNGFSWAEFNNGLPNFITVQGFSYTPTYMYAAVDTGLYQLRNSDTAWSRVFSDGSLICSVTNDSFGLMFVGTGAIYRSTNYGVSWQQTYLALDSTSRHIGAVRSLAICKTGNVIASIGTFKGDNWIVHSSDSGLSWKRINFGYYFDQLAVNPISGSILGIQKSIVNWLFRSTDEGASWTVQDSSLNGDAYASIAFDTSGRLYACGNRGVFVSSNEGADWLNITHNLPSPPIFRSLAIGPNGHLYVGTGLRGIWKSSQRVTSVTSEGISGYPKQFALLQNYPNPFNSSTQIEYSLPHAGFVTLKVFNIMGQVVATLVSQELSAGTYNTRWDATGLASGVYFYRLESGSFVKTKKLLLLR